MISRNKSSGKQKSSEDSEPVFLNFVIAFLWFSRARVVLFTHGFPFELA